MGLIDNDKWPNSARKVVFSLWHDSESTFDNKVEEKMKKIAIIWMMSFVLIGANTLASNRSLSTDIDLKTINKYISENPHDPNLYFVKGQLLAGKNRFKKAKTEFEKVINIYPSFSDAYLELAKVNLGLEENNEALRNINVYLKGNESDAEALFVKGRTLINSHKYEQVLSLSDQMIELNNENGKAYLLKGEANFELGNYDEAHENWHISMKLGEIEAGVHLKYLFEPVW